MNRTYIIDSRIILNNQNANFEEKQSNVMPTVLLQIGFQLDRLRKNTLARFGALGRPGTIKSSRGSDFVRKPALSHVLGTPVPFGVPAWARGCYPGPKHCSRGARLPLRRPEAITPRRG